MHDVLSDTIRRKGRTLFFVDLHVEGIDVLLGVHAPLAIVLGGEDRLFGSGSPAVVGGLFAFCLPTILFDGADGIIVHKSFLRQFTRDVAKGYSLLFLAEGEPIAASAFFFAGAGSVIKE